MKRLGFVIAVIVMAALVLWAIYPAATVRYRLTLEADVDGKPATGAGVIEVSYVRNLKSLPNEAEFSITVRGEAVALDLGQRGTLFALLKGGTDSRSGAEWIVLRAFNLPGGGLPRPVENRLSVVRSLSGTAELPLQSLPLLVRFRDIKDPLSIEKVDPFNLETPFGPGVRLTRATLKIVPAGIWPLSSYGITGEPITTGVGQRLLLRAFNLPGGGLPRPVETG